MGFLLSLTFSHRSSHFPPACFRRAAHANHYGYAWKWGSGGHFGSETFRSWDKQRMRRYGWWTKTCTRWYGKYPIIYKVSYIPGGAGFLPSTVVHKSGMLWKNGEFPLTGIFWGCSTHRSPFISPSTFGAPIGTSYPLHARIIPDVSWCLSEQNYTYPPPHHPHHTPSSLPDYIMNISTDTAHNSSCVYFGTFLP